MSELNQESRIISETRADGRHVRKRHEIIRAILYCSAIAAVFFRGPLFFPRQWVIPYDIAGYHYPLSSLISWSLHEFHQIPWWNPFSYMGQPFDGNLSAAIFYPPTLITVFIGNLLYGRVPYLLFELQLIVHVIVAGVGTCLLLRMLRVGWWPALTGATVYELGAFFASQTQHLGAVSSAAWLPWFFAALYRLEQRRDLRSAALASLPLALLILPGFPAQYLPVLFFAPFLYGIWMWHRNPLWDWKLHSTAVIMFAITITLGFLLSAGSWLPGMQVAHRSAATQRPPSQGLTGVPPEALTSLVWPNLFNQLRGAPWLEMNRSFLHLYQSIPGLLLVLSGLPWLLRSARSRPLVAGMAIALLWMLGETFFVARVLYLLYPRLIHKAIYPEYLLGYFCLFFALLAGLALQGFVDGEREAPYPTKLCWYSSLIAALLSMFLLIAAPAASAVNFQYRATESARFLVVIAVMFAAAGLLVHMWGSSSLTQHRPQVAAAICALIFLDLVTIGSQTELNSYNGVGQDPPAVTFLKQKLGGIANQRIDVTSLAGEWQTRVPEWRLPSANGMDPLLLLDTEKYRSPFSTVTGRVFTLTDPQSPLLDLAGVRYIVTPSQLPHLDGATLIYHADVNIFENLRAMPRFFLVGAVRSATETEAVWGIENHEFDPSRVALVAPEDEKLFSNLSDSASMDQLGSVQLLKYSPNELLLKVSTSRPAVLVATETFWPEWHAAIDGSKTNLCRIDGLFRGLMVPVGTHEVRMFVRPRSVYEAGILFALGILALCFCALRPKRFPAPVGDLDAGHRF